MDYFSSKIEEASKRIPTIEHMLGKGLLQPFSNTNSGARKIMYSVHRDHALPLMNGEKAIIETGYEIRFGDLSSSVTAADTDYVVAKKISKFSFSPNHQYYLIVEDANNKKLDVLERCSYNHITESYGYLYNNQYLDGLRERDFIPQDTIVQKSLAFDEYNNRKDGVNFNTVYLSLDANLEDSIIVSESAAKRLTAPLIKKVSITVNENNIPVNLYGDDKIFKAHPDIGEDIKEGILISLRKEKKEEMPFTESVDNLRRKFMSDQKKRLKGKVIDINIYCNNPERLKTYHNSQFRMYYEEQQRVAHEVVQTVTRYVMEGYQISYELEKLYAVSKQIADGWQFIDKNPFSNIEIEFVILEESVLMAGDKLSNRFGGKGVTSRVVLDELMPRFGPNNERVDIILSMFTMGNRKNPGQVMEQHLNHISHEIVNQILSGNYSVDESFRMILDFLHFASPQQEAYMSNLLAEMSQEEILFFLEDIVSSGNIDISTRPASDSMTIDTLAEMYERFPFVDQYDMKVPMKSSTGKVRFVKARRKAVVAKEYFFRLKQIAEEKFSATSLSATNLRGENTKSKANKNYLIMYPNTPIRFGNMEFNDMGHLGIRQVVEALLIHSVSPHARQNAKKLYTCDPFNIDIKLDKESTNLTAWIVQTYLKAIAKRLRFVKVPKIRVNPININPVKFVRSPIKNPLFFFNKAEREAGFDPDECLRINNEIENGDPDKSPIEWGGTDIRENLKRERLERIAEDTKDMNPRQRYEYLKKHGYMK